MARLQFRSATKSKGFDPIQLSKASLSEMEKRDAAVLKGLQENHAAEMKQRETNLQAMRENDEYTQRKFKENRQIEVDNLQREQTSLNQIAARDRQQAQYDQQATETIVSSIVDFSNTAAKLISKNNAAKLEEEQKGIDALDVDPYIYGAQSYIDFNNASNNNVEGALKANSLIDKEGVESGEPRYQTLKKLIAEQGYNTRSSQRLNNRVFIANVTARKTQLEQTAEFLGASRDPDLARKLHNTAVTDVRTLMRKHHGITNENYFADSIISLREENAIEIKQSTQRKEEDQRDFSVQQATELARGGTTADVTLAKEKLHKTIGYKKTQEWMTDLTLNASSQEEIDAIGNVPTDNGQLYKERWSNLFNDNQAKWNAAQDQKIADNQKQRQVDYNQSTITNQDNLVEAAKQNLPQFIKLTNKQAREEGNGVLHNIIVRIIADQSKANEDELVELEKKAKNGTLSKADVNASSYTNRKAASELYTGQQGSIYGDSEKAITDGLIATARDITDITGDGPNSVQTLLVHAQLKRDFLKTKQSAGFENPLAAWEEVKKNVAIDKENPKGKYYKKVENGRISLPNIELPDVSKEDDEMHNLALTKMLSDGTGTVDLPFILDTPQGMDETFKSSTIPGQIPEFSAGIREFALKYGFSFVEVFNRQRMANNAATGENKPLIKNPVFEQIKAPDISNLIFNKHNNKTQSIRGARTADGTAMGDVRPSMGGGNPTPQQVYDYMRSKGVSDIHARGIVANNAGEAFMTPDGRLVTASVGDNGMSGGIFQMYDDRYRKMEQAVPDWKTNWRGQIDHALQDDSAPQYLQMKFADEVEAANWFMENFERPAEEHRPGRRNHNRDFLQNLGF